MVRGLRPRDCIRWVVDGGGRTVGDVGAVGHATRMRLTRPGCHTNAGRRGRRPLRASARRRYPHHGKRMCKGETSTHALGSPERGAVAARSGVTEGLVQRGCGRTSVTRQLTPGGRGSPPLRRVGSGRGAATSVHRRRHEKGARAVPAGSDTWGGGRMRAHRGKRGCKRSCRTSATGQPRQTSNARAGVEVGWRVEPALSLDQRRRTEDGAPYDVWESFRIVITPSVIEQKGRRGRRPLRWLRDSGFSGAVR